MKGTKLILSVICVIVALAAAVSAIIIFKNEIACFIADIKLKLDEKRLRRNGEYADYAD